MENDIQKLRRDLHKVTIQKAESEKKLQDSQEREKRLEHALQMQKQETLKYQQFQNEIYSLRNSKTELLNQVNDLVEIAKLNSDVKDLIRKIAPSKYNPVIRRNLQNEIVQTNVKEIVTTLEEWVYEMKQILNYRPEVIEGNLIEDANRQ